jgi:hypothetical protein
LAKKALYFEIRYDTYKKFWKELIAYFPFTVYSYIWEGIAQSE